jgi:FdhD protein
MTGFRDVAVTRITPDRETSARRAVPVEAPIAIDYNGIGYAVMMATPTDLDDFAIGFSISERIVAGAHEIEEIDARETDHGWLLSIRIGAARVAPMIERVRVRVSESSCGLCGLENLEQVNRPLPKLARGVDIPASAMFAALAALRDHQPLNRATGAAHAAAFSDPTGAILLAREDVGRHCAFDKLIGAMARAGIDPAGGFALLSSRCSYELVEKAATAGIATLVTISSATTLAVDRAAAAGITLIYLARSDAMLRGDSPAL